MAKRTFGWVQNPNRIDTLRFIVGIFCQGSNSNLTLRNERLPLIERNNLADAGLIARFQALLEKPDICIPFIDLKGKGMMPSGMRSRKNSKCSGIIQACIDAQTHMKLIGKNGTLENMHKPYTDDWTADGYLRWAVSAGLLEYDSTLDTCRISDLGRELIATCERSKEESEVYTKALLSYPPAVRVLSILSSGKVCTKFDIGNQLGFKEELGFTSIPQEVFVAQYCRETSKEQKKAIRSNMEGDSDKYARTITSWFYQMGWAEKKQIEVEETHYGETYKMKMQGYYITPDGEAALKRSRGYNSSERISKIVRYEMLSTKAPDRDYVRLRRALIIKCLEQKNKTLEQIQRYLKEAGLVETRDTILDDILGLEMIGLDIKNESDKYRILDHILDLHIPVKSLQKPDVTALKDEVRQRLKTVNHKYLILFDLAYSDAENRKKRADARDFEIQTAELLTKELDFGGERLGDKDKPDVIIYYDKYGTIIDNKSYKDGFNVNQSCADEMSRYIEQNERREPGIPGNEWWKRFGGSVSEFSFLFVTSFLKGNFKKNLDYIHTMRKTKGGAVGVEHLLYMAEQIKSGEMDYKEFFRLMQNDEIVIPI